MQTPALMLALGLLHVWGLDTALDMQLYAMLVELGLASPCAVAHAVPRSASPPPGCRSSIGGGGDPTLFVDQVRLQPYSAEGRGVGSLSPLLSCMSFLSSQLPQANANSCFWHTNDPKRPLRLRLATKALQGCKMCAPMKIISH